MACPMLMSDACSGSILSVSLALFVSPSFRSLLFPSPSLRVCSASLVLRAFYSPSSRPLHVLSLPLALSSCLLFFALSPPFSLCVAFGVSLCFILSFAGWGWIVMVMVDVYGLNCCGGEHTGHGNYSQR